MVSPAAFLAVHSSCRRFALSGVPGTLCVEMAFLSALYWDLTTLGNCRVANLLPFARSHCTFVHKLVRLAISRLWCQCSEYTWHELPHGICGASVETILGMNCHMAFVAPNFSFFSQNRLPPGCGANVQLIPGMNCHMASVVPKTRNW